MIDVLIHGGGGRMGVALQKVLDDRFNRPANTLEEGDDMATRAARLSATGAVIDFSTPWALGRLCDELLKAPRPLISGTTGIGPEHQEKLDALAHHVPVLWSPNMSLGVLVLRQLVERAAALLPDFDVEIVEAHHHLKVDAPSGTALALAEAAQRARPGARITTGRSGDGARRSDEIGVQAIRGGSVVGDHTVYLLGAGERLALTHHAETRGQFARGAVAAAAWLHNKPAGRYNLEQVLS
jgi:4-hydroxy-tetrahydrodipicolinate reductase